jgi:hypothetical protein
MKKHSNVKSFLEDCSEEEQEYIYEFYHDMSVADLIDLLFEYMPADDIQAEIEDYRREVAEDSSLI